MSTAEQTMSPEDYALLCKLRSHARDTEDTYLQAAEEAKRAKKAMEGAQLRVNKFLDELADGPMPIEEQAERNRESDAAALFEGNKPADEPGTVPVGEEPGEFAVLAESELWKGVPIDEIYVSPAVLKKLKAAGIHTIGDLAEFSNGEKDLTDIGGIGEETKNLIVDAMIDYFKVNPLPPKPQVVEMPPESPESDSPDSGGENVLETPTDAAGSLPGAFPDPPKARRRKKTQGEPENEADPTPDEAE